MTAAIRRTEIVKDLKKRQSLAGIWRGKGFEKIVDIEAELREARKDLNAAIDRRRNGYTQDVTRTWEPS